VGPEHLEVAKALSSLGLMYYKKGDYISAEPLLKRALAIVEKVLEPNHRFIVAALINLSEVHIERGNYVAAEPLLNRAIEMIEKMAGPDDPELAKPLTQLAAIYGEKGDYTRAVTQLERALRIKEKVLGPNDPELAVYLSNLAVMYQSKGDYQKRNEMYERWIEIQKKGGLEDINVVNTLANVANVQILSGNYADAEKYLKLASRMTERVLGPEHPELATYQTNLGELYRRTGNYAEAEQLLNRALAIREKALGPNHPGVARCLSDLAALSNARDDIKAAIAFESRSTEIFEHNLTAILSTGSEHQKKLYMALLSGQTDAVVSLHVRRAPNDPQALRLALTTVLRRKGRVLSAMSDQIAALRGRLNPQDKALLDKLLLMRSRLAALMLNEPTQSAPAQHQAAVEKLEEEVQQFEAAVSERSSEFRALLQPVSIEALQKLIPSGAALVELVLYRPFDAKAKTAGWAYGAEHYVAYMLRREGEPSFVDLGEAAPINQAVLRLRSSLASPKSSTVKQAARALDELVMRPVRNLLGETNMVLLSPDGELNLMPFGALVDEQGRYLVENYTFNYLTSGRDLLRLETQTEPRQQPVVIANPSFDLAVTIGGQKVPERSGDRGLRSLDFKTLPIKPLPGTAQEASAIKSIMPSALVLTEVAATEAALKQVAGPRVLHIATHGFFLKDQPLRTVVASRRFEMEEAPRAVQGENPLLRSGLVLAGVTKGQSGAGEDGVLTALEVSGLDLWGTKLVVLSACETAVGDVANGEGVYGLRRALVLAGAESQLMSLWKVSDTGTRDLMINYYTRLQRGESRTEALRQVQLAMLQGKLLPSPKTTSDKQKGRRETGETADNVTVRDYRHPYYWASFIPSGNWRNLTGQE
jgi:CHAT domain-containing protein/Tfp pilus assembly protein PilF